MPMMTLFDKRIQLRMGQANVRRWIDDIMPLLDGDDDPLGVEDLATHQLPLEQAPRRLRDVPEEGGRRDQGRPQAAVMKLEGKTVLVTGANRGIGRAIASELLERGSTVLAGVRERDREHTAPGEEVQLDLSSRESIDHDLTALGLRTAEIDILINNAGYFEGGLYDEIDYDDLYRLIQVNVAAPMHLTRSLLPGILAREEGLIVNNASIIGAAPFPGAVAYAATKGAMVAFSESLRRELHRSSVDLLELITPGIDTEMMHKVQEQLDPHIDTSGWDHVDPEDWAGKVADAIESGRGRFTRARSSGLPS